MYSKQLLVISIVLFSLCVYGCYYSYQIPESFHKNLANLDYSHRSYFNYNVTVEPVSIYNYETVLTNDNKTMLYGTPISRKLTKEIDIGFHYEFNQTPILINLTNIKIFYECRTFLNCSDLTKMIIFNDSKPISSPFNSTLQINVTSLEQNVDIFSLETETNNTSFSYHFIPRITVNAMFREEPISLIFNPSFVLSFKEDRIVMTGFTKEFSERLRFLERIPVTWNEIPISFLRRAYLVSLFTLGLFIIISLRRVMLQTEMEGFFAVTRKDTISQLVNVRNFPAITEEKIIQATSLRDLTKIAKRFKQPILTNGNTFVVLHQNTRYQYSHSRES